jgi:hypothetical protein
LRDPADAFVLKAAVNGQAVAIVTVNRRDLGMVLSRTDRLGNYYSVLRPLGRREARQPLGRPRKSVPGTPPERRPSRGNNANLIEEILKSIAPRAARPAEIRSTLQREKGVAIAFTSIRHALGQLEARRIVEQVADSKTWRHLG